MTYNGSSEGLSELSAGITVFLFNWVMMKNWGEVGVAAFTAINYMLNLGVQMFVGLSDGIVPILSFNYGAGHLNRVKETLFLGFKTNEIVVHKDEVDSNVYIITKGIWRAYHFKNGEEATAWFATPGELVFSVWGYISDEPSRLSFESMTESEAICLSKEELHRHFNSSITMANLGRRMLENFILLYENWLMDLWKKNAFERYLTLLDEYPEVIQQIPMKYIASYLGVTVQSSSSVISRITRQGFPAASTRGGISRFTTLPAPITAP